MVTGFPPRLKDLVCLSILAIVRSRENGFIPILKGLALSETHTTSTRIWTWFANSFQTAIIVWRIDLHLNRKCIICSFLFYYSSILTFVNSHFFSLMSLFSLYATPSLHDVKYADSEEADDLTIEMYSRYNTKLEPVARIQFCSFRMCRAIS